MTESLRSQNCRLHHQNNRLKTKIESLEAEKIELRAILRSVVDLQQAHYGDGMSTHLALITKAKEIDHYLEVNN